MLLPEDRKKIKLWLDIALGVVGLGALGSFIALVGFRLTEELLGFFTILKDAVIVLFIVQEALRWLIALEKKQYFKERIFENAIFFVIIFEFIFPEAMFSFFSMIFPELHYQQLTLLYLAIIEVSIIYVLALKLLRHSNIFSRINLHPGALFALSFAVIILIGTLALMLPRATHEDTSFQLIDALFTSTSAVCVTGLIVVDTAERFTILGKLIILCLIQVGGLGVMTLTTFFAIFSGGLSFKVRVMMKDMLSNENIGEVTGLLMKITAFTLTIEFLGAMFLYFSQGGSVLALDRHLLYISIFHSVSAFCNAGFSIFTLGLAEPAYQGNYFFNTIIMILIILGGLGFAVLSNLSLQPKKMFSRTRRTHKISINAKIVILTSICLIISGWLLIFLSEPFNFDTNFTFFEKAFHSLFLSVTARTAGFNTLPIDLLSAPTLLVLIFLMWVGASPGSTGGGIKTTTFFLAVYSFVNQIRGKERFELSGRQIPNETVHRAFLVIFASLFTLSIGVLILAWLEPDKALSALFFEAVSAIGTVGLSLGITSRLGDGGKVVIILLMFIGRIGALTFFLAFHKPPQEPRYSLPKEQVMIG